MDEGLFAANSLVDSVSGEEALGSLELEDSRALVDSQELEELVDSPEELEDSLVLEEVTLHREARGDTHLKEAKVATHLKEVKEAILHRHPHPKEVKEVILHKHPHPKEAREDTHPKEVRALLLLLRRVDPRDLTPPHLSQLLRSPPRPRAPLDLAPPTLTLAVLVNITRSGTTRTAPWPRSRRGSTTTTSTPSRWSTGGLLTRESGPGSPPCFRMADSSAAAPSSPGSTSSPPLTASLT